MTAEKQGNKVRYKYRKRLYRKLPSCLMVVPPFYLVVRFKFSRFLFRNKSVHAAVRALPVVTSVLKEMRLAQSCT